MADEYTPTTSEVRSVWAAWAEYGGLTSAPSGFEDDHLAEFNRWLAAHTRAVCAIAWDAAVRSMRYEDGTPVELVTNINPYRAAEGGADRA